MKNGIRTSLYLAAVALISCAPSFAVDFRLTGVSGGVMGGVYTSPYIAQIGSQIGTADTTLVMCDDFTTESSLDVTFTASETTVAALTGPNGVKFDQPPAATLLKQQEDYATAAFLAEEIVTEDTKAAPSTYQLGILSFALWGVFDVPLLTAPNQGTPSCALPYGCLTSQQLTDAKAALTYAESKAGSYSQYSNVSIYTPSPLDRSQEFLAVRAVSMAEPSLSLLGFYLPVLAGLAFAFRRGIIYGR